MIHQLPGPGQESVWDYPRPPLLAPTTRRLIVEFGGQVIADTTQGYRVLETSHPPVYYFPVQDVRMEFLILASGSSFCEWKGSALYYSIHVGDKVTSKSAWAYPNPTPEFLPIRDFIAFYAHRMERCSVDGQLVQPQPGEFYGGWITPEILGPFKGEPGSSSW